MTEKKKQYKVYEDDLSNYRQLPDNPNAGSERGQYMLEKSVEQFGSGRSLVAAGDNTLLAGNHASDVLGEKLGTKAIVVETEGDVVVIHKRSDLSSDSELGRGLALADNRASDFHEYDKDVLAKWKDNGELELETWFSAGELETVLQKLPEKFPEYDESLTDDIMLAETYKLIVPQNENEDFEIALNELLFNYPSVKKEKGNQTTIEA